MADPSWKPSQVPQHRRVSSDQPVAKALPKPMASRQERPPEEDSPEKKNFFMSKVLPGLKPKRALAEELEQMRAQLEQELAEKASLEDQHHALRDNLRHLHNAYQSAMEENQGFRQENEALKRTVEQLNMESGTLRKSWAATESSLRDLQTQYALKENEVHVLHREVELLSVGSSPVVAPSTPPSMKDGGDPALSLPSSQLTTPSRGTGGMGNVERGLLAEIQELRNQLTLLQAEHAQCALKSEVTSEEPKVPTVTAEAAGPSAGSGDAPAADGFSEQPRKLMLRLEECRHEISELKAQLHRATSQQQELSATLAEERESFAKR
eukprot:RCo038470